MRGKQLIDELTEECRTQRGRVEDFLNALKDIVVDRLTRGETVAIQGFGTFEKTKGRERPFRFRFCKDMYPRLGINSKINLETCEGCGKEKPMAGRRVGRKCLAVKQREYRDNAKKRVRGS